MIDPADESRRGGRNCPLAFEFLENEGAASGRHRDAVHATAPRFNPCEDQGPLLMR
jgi:hypothetical protein